MAGELVETGRLWARQNAAIKPEWAERIGAHLVKRTYSEPHWSKKRAAVMAHERVTLYGVPLVADRLVAVRPDRPRAEPRAVHPARPRVRRVVQPAPLPRARTSGCSRRPRSSSTAPGAATSSSTSTPSSTSTTPGSAPRSSAAPTSTLVEAGAAGAGPTCSPSTRRCSPTTPPRRCARRTSPRHWQQARGPDLPDQLPLRARRRRRRPHHRRPGRDPQPGRRRRLLLERPRPARRSWSPA